MSLIRNPWFASILGAACFLGTMTATIFKQAPKAAPPEPEAELPLAGPSWTFHNAEMDLLITELRGRKDGLDQREASLRELEDRLRSERQEMNIVTQQIARLQQELDQKVTTIKAEEMVNLKRLAKLYSSMSPDATVKAFKDMEESTVIKILGLLKDTDFLPIFEAINRTTGPDAKRLSQLAEKTRLVVRPAKTTPTQP
jgi:hypothetical protein